ncbi:MAG TPA: cell envelope biogenesis protein OmpA, partial [Paracoccus sp.]|nr:cell envelope biogenesis protein OmpA [Paracoccus sp. (in: a-proteobacteria)]
MKWYSCAAAMVAALFLHWSAHAQDVTLSSADGTLTVSGDLIAYDGEYLRLETEFGPLTLDARGLTCTGPGCPLLSGGVAEVTIEGA